MLDKVSKVAKIRNRYNQVRLAFYLFPQTRLMNSIKQEHSCKILYLSMGVSSFVFQQYSRRSGINAHRLDWLQSLKQFFINVSHHILVASLTLMALF